ncbi:MAG: hypothetical protein NTU61_02805 [Candidatus Altiarchaeota archaeon]|nr:hypothetical protein [Candidatus Altiarchaeota archaeon]
MVKFKVRSSHGLVDATVRKVKVPELNPEWGFAFNWPDYPGVVYGCFIDKTLKGLVGYQGNVIDYLEVEPYSRYTCELRENGFIGTLLLQKAVENIPEDVFANPPDDESNRWLRSRGFTGVETPFGRSWSKLTLESAMGENLMAMRSDPRPIAGKYAIAEENLLGGQKEFKGEKGWIKLVEHTSARMKFTVQSNSGNGTYEILYSILENKLSCNCPSWCKRAGPNNERTCWHVKAAEEAVSEILNL